MNIKSNKIVLAVIAVLSFVFAYLYDKWKYNNVGKMSSIGYPLMKQFINIFALVGLVASFATCGSTTKK